MDFKSRKQVIRKAVTARILAMLPDDRRAQEAALNARFECLPGLAEANTVLLYASAFPEELETSPMLRRTLELRKRLILPRVDSISKTLHLFEIIQPDRDLVPGHRKIPEPASSCHRVDPSAIDWVLVPGVAFNSVGYRLGRGAGHYDKLLPTLRPEVPRWALIFDTQWLEDLPIEPHDQPIDGVADYATIIDHPRRRDRN